MQSVRLLLTGSYTWCLQCVQQCTGISVVMLAPRALNGKNLLNEMDGWEDGGVRL